MNLKPFFGKETAKENLETVRAMETANEANCCRCLVPRLLTCFLRYFLVTGLMMVVESNKMRYFDKRAKAAEQGCGR